MTLAGMLLAAGLAGSAIAQPAPESSESPATNSSSLITHNSSLYIIPRHLVPAEASLDAALERAVNSVDWPTTPPVRLTLDGVPDAWRLHEMLIAGDGAPTPDGMRRLREAGVRTLISVATEAPNHYDASVANLGYVHIPMRPGRINPEEFLRFLRVLTYLEGSYYVHGTPGDTRPYVAAAMALNLWERRGPNRALRALDGMEVPRDDVALWLVAASDLSSTQIDQARTVPADFPLVVPPPPLTWWMQLYHEMFEVLRESAEWDWQTPPAAVDTTAAYEARTLAESAAAWRQSNPRADAELRERMADIERYARELHTAIRPDPPDIPAANAAWTSLQATCAACHAVMRDKE